MTADFPHSPNADYHATESPSAWVARFAPLVPFTGVPFTGVPFTGVPHTGRVLDLACGAGRHTRLLANLGHRVLAVDKDVSRLGDLIGLASVTVQQADLENAPWPFGAERFAGIVVTNYLHRPLLARLPAALLPDGVLIYETFARGNERFGKPANPDFLLLPGELLDACHGRARVVAYEDVVVDQPKPAAVQRICAVHTQ